MPNISIIKALQEEELFAKFLNPRGKGFGSWRRWMAALRALYGLPMGSKSKAAVAKFTGRDPNKLPKGGFERAVFLVGRRGGKSQTTALIGAYEAALAGHEQKIAPTEEGVVACLATTKDKAMKVYQHIDGIFSPTVSPLLDKMVVERSKTAGILLNNGIRIKTEAANPATVRGDTMVAAIVDEACFLGYHADAKVKSDTELMRAIEPALATTQGKLIAISSVYARKGWCYEQWRDCYGVEGADTLVWQAVSRDMNPTLSEAWIQRRLAKDPVGARAEYLSVWRDDIVLLFTRPLVEDRVVPCRYELPPEYAKGGQSLACRYMGFVDLSGGRYDASAVAIAHKEGKGHVVLDYLEWWDAPHSPAEVCGHVAKVLRRYGIKHVRGDNYAGEWPVDAFRGHGIRYERSPLVKNDLYHELVPIFTSGDITLLNCPRLVDELCALERTVRSGGKDRIDHPPEAHDDVANALAGVATMCKPAGLVATADPGGGPGNVENTRQAMAAMLAHVRPDGSGILHLM